MAINKRFLVEMGCSAKTPFRSSSGAKSVTMERYYDDNGDAYAVRDVYFFPDGEVGVKFRYFRQPYWNN